MRSRPTATAATRAAALAVCLCLATGCASTAAFNYRDADGPRFAGSYRTGAPRVGDPSSFLVASYNVKLADEPLKALQTLRKGGLERADILLLQEMDELATEAMAAVLGMEYVYYPATVHPFNERPFGVAILSPWPIQGDYKILLPDYRDSRDPAAKVAAAAVVWVRGIPVGVINAHLQLGLSPEQTHEQMQTIVDCAFSDACGHPDAPLLPPLEHVVLAGDLNTSNEGKMRAADAVLASAELRRVPGIGRTFKYLFLGLGKLDHIYASPTLAVEDSGQVRGFFGTGSDHYPVYARLRLLGDTPEPWDGFEQERGGELR